MTLAFFLSALFGLQLATIVTFRLLSPSSGKIV